MTHNGGDETRRKRNYILAGFDKKGEEHLFNAQDGLFQALTGGRTRELLKLLDKDGFKLSVKELLAPNYEYETKKQGIITAAIKALSDENAQDFSKIFAWLAENGELFTLRELCSSSHPETTSIFDEALKKGLLEALLDHRMWIGQVGKMEEFWKLIEDTRRNHLEFLGYDTTGANILGKYSSEENFAALKESYLKQKKLAEKFSPSLEVKDGDEKYDLLKKYPDAWKNMLCDVRNGKINVADLIENFIEREELVESVIALDCTNYLFDILKSCTEEKEKDLAFTLAKRIAPRDNEELWKACRNGDIARVRAAVFLETYDLDYRKESEGQEHNQGSLIYQALLKNDCEMVKLLFGAGARDSAHMSDHHSSSKTRNQYEECHEVSAYLSKNIVERSLQRSILEYIRLLRSVVDKEPGLVYKELTATSQELNESNDTYCVINGALSTKEPSPKILLSLLREASIGVLHKEILAATTNNKQLQEYTVSGNSTALADKDIANLYQCTKKMGDKLLPFSLWGSDFYPNLLEDRGDCSKLVDSTAFARSIDVLSRCDIETLTSPITITMKEKASSQGSWLGRNIRKNKGSGKEISITPLEIIIRMGQLQRVQDKLIRYNHGENYESLVGKLKDNARIKYTPFSPHIRVEEHVADNRTKASDCVEQIVEAIDTINNQREKTGCQSSQLR